MHATHSLPDLRLPLALALGTLSALDVGGAPRTPNEPAAPREYRVEASHTSVEFSVGFLASRVRGRFNDMRGVVLYDEADPTRSSVMVVLDAKSVDTGSKHRDEHLRSEDFFDADRYPTIVFESSRVERRRGSDTLVAVGTLTMHGVSRPVRVPFRPVARPTRDPHGVTIIAFAGAVTLARKDFGIAGGDRHNPWFDALRSATMGDSVEVALEVEAFATDYERRHDAGIDTAVARIERVGMDSAAALVRAAAAKQPDAFKDNWLTFEQLAGTLAARGRPADALTVLRLNVELHPSAAEPYAMLGNAYRQMGDTAAGATYYRRALAIDPDEPRARLWMKRLGG